MKRLLSPIKIYGGSSMKVNHILPQIEWKTHYVEPFCGAISVLLNSPDFTATGQPIRKYAFDRNMALIETWRLIQEQPERLQRFLSNVSYDRENFEFARKYVKDHENCIEDESQYFMLAAQFLIRNRFSRSADEKTFGWSDRLRRGKPEYISAWETMLASLPAVSRKIRNVTFDSGHAVDLIIDHGLNEVEDCTIFADPPFCHESRSSSNNYKWEMETYDKDAKFGELTHECMLDFFLRACEGTTYLLGYHNPLYTQRIGDKVLYEWKSKVSASATKTKGNRQNVLWRLP